MRALITGATGFVGRHLKSYLESAGDEVVGLTDDVDIAHSASLFGEFERLAANPFDAIYHLAALAHVGDSFGSAMEVFRVNVLGTVNLLEVARKFFPQARILYVSSSEVYGKVPSASLPVDESVRLAPLSPYAASKAAAEQAVKQAFMAYQQKVLIARPFNHIGPGQSDSYVVSALAKRVLKAKQDGKPSIVVGNLASKRDFTDVRDVIAAYRRIIEAGISGETYNVCSGKSTSVRDLAEMITELAGAEVALEIDPSLARDVEVTDICGDASKCQEALSWKPVIPIADSLRDVLGWWSVRLRASQGSSEDHSL